MADQVLIALGGLAVGALGILSNAAVQIWSTRRSAELKEYEITFPEKRSAFVALMDVVNKRAYNALGGATEQTVDVLSKTHTELTSLLYGLAPFLGDARWARERVDAVEKAMIQVFHEGEYSERRRAFDGPLREEITKFQEQLFERLFRATGKP